MKLDRHEIAFLLRYSTAEKFCSSMKEYIENLLNEQMIEQCGKNKDGVPEYKVSNFGHMMVEKIQNIVAAYGVEVFRIEKPEEEQTIAIGNDNPFSNEHFKKAAENPINIGFGAGNVAEALSDDQISAAKSDNSHYAEEVDGEVFYYNMEDAYNWVTRSY